jgi:hypothetical protein
VTLGEVVMIVSRCRTLVCQGFIVEKKNVIMRDAHKYNYDTSDGSIPTE